jgi:hypothetical protein
MVAVGARFQGQVAGSTTYKHLGVAIHTFGRQVPHFQFEKVSCSDISCHGQLYLHVGGSKGTQWQQTAQQGSATVKCTPVGIWYIYILLSHTLNLVRIPLTMPAVKWQFVQRRSKAERARDRGRLVLWDASITKKTQERYYSGLQKLLPVLVKVTTFLALDEKICDWIQRAWDEGECQHVVGDALCGLHRYEAWTKSHIPNSWKLFKVWRRLEHPNRAPPLVPQVLEAWTMYSLCHRDFDLAALLMLGFYGLLRTGELLQLRPCDVLVGETSAVISLTETKTSLKNSVKEMVSFDNTMALEIVRDAIEYKKQNNLTRVPFWTKSGSQFRKEFLKLSQKFDLEKHNFRGYSLRRGGATHLFQSTGSMEKALLAGRWGSHRVARLYICDGLSHLPSITFSSTAKAMLKKWAPTNCL